MDYKFLIFTKENMIGTLTINRPDALNALNIDLMDELDKILDQIKNDKEIRVLIITGIGKSFVAGADISSMKPMGYVEGKNYGIKGSALFRKIEVLEIPVIGAINGFALGGGLELAMSCDIRFSSEKAKFGQPEVGLGITPGFGGTQRLPRIVGVGKAKELIFSGKIINSIEAAKIGLVNDVFPKEDLLDKSIEFSKELLKKAPIALKYVKIAINEGMQTDIENAIKIENELFGKCFATTDQEEGMNAFLEKRKPNYTNN